ncbi:MAG: toll/interleukin-1 receptor domain-containing protein [Candidatus Korobacteraceae bacterium]
MANQEHLAILRQGVEEWNKWRDERPDVKPDLSEAHLSRANLSGADLHGANLSEADLSGNSPADARFCWLNEETIVAGANLTRANLRGADLSSTNLCVAILIGADLNGAKLVGSDLVAAGLPWAKLVGADLSEADLSGADLGAANLTSAQLRWANLTGADLGDTDLSGADLSGANLRTAQVTGANLSGASAGGTIFSAIDLSFAKGLETVIHGGPSTVGIDTIYASRGKIPEVFLRGCGVPDEFIAYIGSMVGRPIEFYSCFISYSTRDKEFAERLNADLQAKGVRCWFAPHDMHGGRKIHEQIDEAIRLHDRLLLILSEHSVSSEWVKTELAKARKREVKEGKRVLFPVRLVPFEVLRDWECFDGDTGKDSAREIREYFIPDFSNWKDHDSYQTAFQRLVKDLKAEARQ